MPFTLPSRTPSGPRRRSLLAGAAGAGAALLTGCSSDSSPGTTGGSSPAAARARARAARDSERLAQRYRAVLAAHPALDARLSPLLAEVVRHAEAFGAGGRASDAASASAPATPAGDSSADPPVGASPSPSPAVPATEKAARAELAAAERALTDRRMKALADVPGELARLLASVAAAGAGHAFLLTEDEK